MRPPLARGERILAVSNVIGDQPAAIGSTRALYYRDDDQSGGWARVGWEEFDHANWRPDECTLTLTGLAGSERPPLTLHLSTTDRLPEVSRDRIAAAIITTSRAALDPGDALITVRRRPGSDALVWTVQLNDDLDPTDPDVHRRVDTAIRTMRTDLGL